MPRHWPCALFALLVACSGGDNLGPAPSNSGFALALGDRHVCLARPGRTECWGWGIDGQLGIGTTPEDTTPVTLPDTTTFVALTAGATHTCGINADGAAFCWGSDRDGQLGLGAAPAERCGVFACATTPQPVAGNLRFRALAAGYRFTCGLTTTGAAYCWGLNDVGQLGSEADGETCEEGRCSRTPLPEASGLTFKSLAAGLAHVCALDPDGKMFCWGWDGPAGTGEGHHPTFTPNAYPVEGTRFRQLTAGGYHTCGVTKDDAAYCWGIDAIGAGPIMLESYEPVPVVGGIHFGSIRAARVTTCGLDTDGAAYCWGPNANGEIGQQPVGSLQRFDEPVAVSGGLRFQILAGGNSTYCGITQGDGRTACWGRGEYGELGTGYENSTSPVIVPVGD